MPLPTPETTTRFPVPETGPAGFPAPEIQYGAGTGTGNFTSTVGSYRQSTLGQILAAQRAAELQSMGLPPGANENSFSIDEASTMTDTALAKIAVYNPELAQQLQDARESGDKPEEEGFWASAWGGIKEGFFKVVDLVTRPGRIIPELLADEGDPFWEDIGQALAGESTNTWDDVLDKWGMEEGPFRSTLAFVGDVATDPLTYVGLGAMGRGTQAAKLTIGKAGFVASMSDDAAGQILDTMATNGAKISRLGVTPSEKLYHSIVSSGGLSQEAAAASAVDQIGGAIGTVYNRSRLAADELIRMRQAGIPWSRVPDVLPESQLPKTVVQKQLASMRTFGTPYAQAAGRKAAYLEAVTAAGAQGGLRVRFAFPFTGLRYVSPAIPLSDRMGFQTLRRFFGGQSGSVRLWKAVQSGTAEMTDWNNWVKFGPEAAITANPALRNIMGGPGDMGSGFYRMSDMVGRFTAHFLPGAKALRSGGLAGMITARHMGQVKNFRRKFMEETGFTHKKYDGDPLAGQKTANEVRGALETIADDPLAYSFLERVPSREAWLNDVDNKFADLKGKFTPEQAEAMLMLREMMDQVRVEELKSGLVSDTVSINLHDASSLQRTQADEWATGSAIDEPLFIGATRGEEGADWLGRGVTDRDRHIGAAVDPDNLTGQGDGFHLSSAGGEGASEVRVQLRNPLRGTEEWDRWSAELEPQVRIDLENQGLTEAEVENLLPEKLDAAVTDRLRQSKFDGRIWADKNGTRRVLALDPQNVKVVHDEASWVVQDRGYAPRVYSEKFKLAIGQHPSQAADEINAVASRIQHTMNRRFADLSAEDAEKQIRRLFEENGFPDLAKYDGPVFERNVLRLHEQYVGQAAEGIIGVKTGQLLRSLGDVNLTGGISLGGISGRTLWRYPDFTSLKVRAALSADARNAGAKLHRRMAAAAKTRTKVLGNLQPAILRLQRELDAGGVMPTVRQGAPDLRVELPAIAEEAKTLRARLSEARKAKDKPGVEAIEREMDLLRGRIETVRKQAMEGPARRARGVVRARGDVKKIENVLRRLSAGVDEIQKLDAMYRTEVAAVKPALSADRQLMQEGAEKFVQIRLPGVPGEMFAHPYIAEEINSLFHRVGTQPGDLGRFWRTSVMGRWKTWATVMSVGFHIRNNLGAMFNNLLGGTDMTDYVISSRLQRVWEEGARGAAKAQKDKAFTAKWANKAVKEEFLARYSLRQWFPEGQRITYGDVVELIDNQGVSAANSLALEATHDYLSLQQPFSRGTPPGVGGAPRGQRKLAQVPVAGKVYQKAGASVDWWQRKMENVMAASENLHRYAGFLTGMRSSAGDLGAARLNTMMRHGDYADLTDFEYRVVRDLVPFYKWMRTNLPYQVHQLFEVPGKVATVAKIRDWAWNAYGQDWDEAKANMPSWMREEYLLPFDTPGGAMHTMVLDLPLSDLNAGFNDYLSMVLPTVRPFMEALIGKDFFSGGELTGEYKPLPGYLNWMGALLSGVGLAKPNAEGGYSTSDKVEKIFSIVPVYSRFRNWFTDDPKRAQLRMGTMASALFGTRIIPINEELLTQAELEFYFRNIEPLTAQLRSLGVRFPEKTDLTASAYEAAGLKPPVEE